MAKTTKATLKALENVFSAEINGSLPFQSKAAIYRKLVDEGLIADCKINIGTGWSAVVCNGYELTHAGRFVFCENCEEPEGGNA